MAHEQVVHSMASEKMFSLYVFILKLMDGFLITYHKDLLLLKEILECCSITRHDFFSFVRLIFLIHFA